MFRIEIHNIQVSDLIIETTIHKFEVLLHNYVTIVLLR